MTETLSETHTPTRVPVGALTTAAIELARAGRGVSALTLLEAVQTGDPADRARIALAAAEAVMEGVWFTDFDDLPARLATVDELAATVELDPAERWDLAFLHLRHDYATMILGGGSFRPGPEGKDPEAMAELRRRGAALRDQAPDDRRRGWTHMYLGLISDNVFGDRDASPADYTAALQAGEAGDDLLAREALRHLGDHAHGGGDHKLALERWRRATALGARGGTVAGTLSQQILLVVLARDAGDEAGARALAAEIARWAEAIGARRLAEQATSLMGGADPTEQA